MCTGAVLQGFFQTTYILLAACRPYLYAIVHHVGPFDIIGQATLYALF